MSSNRIKYAHDGSNFPLYSLSKGRKPQDMSTCHFSSGELRVKSGIQNYYVLANMQPVARVQSRHRVSPSPRKIPNYELDIMALEMLSKMAVDVHMPLEMMLKQQTSIRRNLPRFR